MAIAGGLEMTESMMDGGMIGGWPMGGLGILIIAVLLLAAAALIKYLFFNAQRDD